LRGLIVTTPALGFQDRIWTEIGGIVSSVPFFSQQTIADAVERVD